MIDTTKIITADQRAAAELQAKRQAMVLPRLAFKSALMQAGLLDQIEALIDQADPLTRLKWREAVIYPRTDPMIDQLGALAGLTAEQIDQMFGLAAEL